MDSSVWGGREREGGRGREGGREGGEEREGRVEEVREGERGGGEGGREGGRGEEREGGKGGREGEGGREGGREGRRCEGGREGKEGAHQHRHSTVTHHLPLTSRMSMVGTLAMEEGVRGGGSGTGGSCKPVLPLIPALTSCSLACWIIFWPET